MLEGDLQLPDDVSPGHAHIAIGDDLFSFRPVLNGIAELLTQVSSASIEVALELEFPFGRGAHKRGLGEAVCTIASL